ncbi:7681_t:CDS:10 [Ambispora leptoticha]|uniref:General vesicular transport factor p115 n=1 Tax=Ambispora leptoticha TaxID=144679 RepID=A0A9N8ZXL3_9GLOM|nr:7681_t:CDS:10 [Ambispora leptoticha]
MEFLQRGYKGLLGDKGQTQSAADTVIKLCDRVNNSTLLEDRRAAVLGLKGLSREYRLLRLTTYFVAPQKEVGESGLPVLLRILDDDKDDIDIVKAILEVLNILCTPERQEDSSSNQDLGVRFTDELVNEPKNIHLLLELLKQFDFYVRYHDVQLLSKLLMIRPERVQECVLTAPMGIPRLMDLLNDRREIIRNEGLLLLIALTETNAEIQKIVAFEDAFENLLEIIAEEDGLHGGIIVQDCLQLIVNLLRYNVLNQNSFRETSCIQRIPALLGHLLQYQQNSTYKEPIEFLTQDWPEQLVSNTYVLLELIRILVVPNNTNTVKNQNVMHQYSVLKPIIELALASNAPSPLKAQALYALADLIRANQASQEYLEKIVIAIPHLRETPPPYNEKALPPQSYNEKALPPQPYNEKALPPRPAVMALIAIAVGAEHVENYATRAAATYAFECYICNNPEAQIVVASTLTPPPDLNPDPYVLIAKSQSAGTLLLSAILEWEESAADPYVVWFASVIFSHILKNNERAKEFARLIDTGDVENDEEAVSLLHAIAGNLMMATRQNADVRVLIGYLCLLCVWLWDSPKSVRDFLSEGAHLQILITPITQSSGVDTRVQGLCAFLLGICYEFNDEEDVPINRSTLQPILQNRIGVDQFINRIARLREIPNFKHASQYLQVTPEEEEKGLPDLFFDYSFVEFFKNNYEIIQRSITVDPKAGPAPRRSADLNGGNGSSSNDYYDISAAASAASATIVSLNTVIQNQEQQIDEMKEQISKLKESLEVEKTVSANEIASLTAQISSLQSLVTTQQTKQATLEKEQEDIMVLLADQDETIKKYRRRLRELGEVNKGISA